ncbi:hypothetical protein [Streptomyces sp. LN704]|uniref:hypothetical protein n=1 Tax=unclassified Streptomyces TaxID=2593676 RepID=UPI00371D2551
MTALPTELPTLPAWNTPVITPSLIVAEGLVPISIYGDEVWSLAPLIANPSGVRVGIDWSRFPDPFREEIQPAAWTMINTVLPASVRVGHPAWHSRLGPHGLYDTARRWQRFAHWASAHGVAGRVRARRRRSPRTPRTRPGGCGPVAATSPKNLSP